MAMIVAGLCPEDNGLATDSTERRNDLRYRSVAPASLSDQSEGTFERLLLRVTVLELVELTRHGGGASFTELPHFLSVGIEKQDGRKRPDFVLL